jgi:hypothetical protein
MFQPVLLANLQLESTLIDQIVEAQKTDAGITHIKEHMAMDPTMCFHMDHKGILWFKNRLVVPKVPELRQQILDESHTSRYSIHPGSNKMYQDLKSRFWWTKMKIEIVRYVARCDVCQRVKAVHLKSAGPLQSLPISEGKWEDINMDFIVGLPKTSKGYDSIWVIVDRFTKVAHFLPVRTLYPTKTYAELYIARIMSLHGVPKTIVSDRGPQFVSRFWEEFHKSLGTKLIHSSAYHPQTSGQTKRVNQILEDMLRACVLVYSEKWDECLPLAEFSYNNSYQESIQMAPFEALYGQRCRTPLNWSGPDERFFFGPDLVKEAEEKVKLIQHRLKVAQHRHKRYADKRRRPLFFQVGDFVYLKVSPMKGVNRFGIKGKLAPHYVGPFEILAWCGDVAYKVKLPEHLSAIHNVFHVSQLKKCLQVPDKVVEISDVDLEPDLTYSEHPIKIVDQQERVTRRKTIKFYKVQWNKHSEDEATWESEEFLNNKFPKFLESCKS